MTIDATTIRTHFVHYVTRVADVTPEESTADALCDLSEIYMFIKGTYGGSDAEIAKVIDEIKSFLGNVTDPGMQKLLQAALACFPLDAQGKPTINANTKAAFAAFWGQTPKESNPVYQILQYFKQSGFRPEDCSPDTGYRFALFYLSFYEGGLESLGITADIEKILGKGFIVDCKGELWKFLLTYAKENHIDPNMLIAILPDPKTTNLPNYTDLITNLEKEKDIYPSAGDRSAADIWNGYLSTFLDPAS